MTIVIPSEALISAAAVARKANLNIRALEVNSLPHWYIFAPQL